jgi:hypothetical protein
MLYSAYCLFFVPSKQATRPNLVPQACDPREGTRGSGIIRFREESDWPLKLNALFNLSQDIPGFRQRIIPEPRVPSRGSQARGNEIGLDPVLCSIGKWLIMPQANAPFQVQN